MTGLRNQGLEIVLMPHAARGGRYTSGTTEERLEDLHAAFEDNSIKAIICSIGGQLSSQLLHKIDYDLIAAHPKIFCGYSDITSLHSALGKKSNLVTFYGPAVMPDWAELPGPHPVTSDWFRRATADRVPLGPLPSVEEEVAEHVDWSIDRPRSYKPAPGLRSLRPGAGRGPLAGGCLPVLTEMLGTPWFPDLRGAVLLVETPQAPYSSAAAATDLWHLRNADVFDGLSALLVGRPFLGQERAAFDEVVLEACGGFSFPIIADVACGHTSPNLTLPLGVEVRVTNGRAEILESGVRGE
jgi:muramoyltetrapeptide carboxypeptidase